MAYIVIIVHCPVWEFIQRGAFGCDLWAMNAVNGRQVGGRRMHARINDGYV